MNDTYAPTKTGQPGGGLDGDLRAAAAHLPRRRHHLQDAGAEVGYSPADIAVGINTIRRRRSIVGPGYPFRTAGGGVAAESSAADRPWTPLLLMSSESPLRSPLTTSTRQG